MLDTHYPDPRSRESEQKKQHMKRFLLPILATVIALGPSLTAGCTSKALALPLPYIPPAYYNCIEANPWDLAAEYWDPHVDLPSVKRMYDGKAFVFKDIELDEKMLSYRDKGYIWLGWLKCYIENTDKLHNLRVGDSVDIVGINGGLAKDFLGLNFINCIVLETGKVQLPAEGKGGSFSSGY